MIVIMPVILLLPPSVTSPILFSKSVLEGSRQILDAYHSGKVRLIDLTTTDSFSGMEWSDLMPVQTSSAAESRCTGPVYRPADRKNFLGPLRNPSFVLFSWPAFKTVF